MLPVPHLESPALHPSAGVGRAPAHPLDPPLTTLLCAPLLFFVVPVPVRGFSVPSGLGIFTTVFTAFTVTRLSVATWVRWRRPTHVPI